MPSKNSNRAIKQIVVETFGKPEEMQLRDAQSREPGAGEVLIQVTAAGVNFMDTGQRRGMLAQFFPLPLVPGVEGAGRLMAVGAGVNTLKVGQRVAWVFVPGSYSEQIIASADALVPLPDDVDDETAASLMMQGITASHFATDFYAIRPGDVALIHAAAGGVGILLTQIIKLRGGKVIGRVSSEDKAKVARKAGADHVIVDNSGKFADEVLRLTGGKGVHVVYDGSGPVTFDDSLRSLRLHGVLAWYGPVLGSPKPIDLSTLPNSVLVGYPRFMDHVPDREALIEVSTQLFDWVKNGQLVLTKKTYPLAQAAQAHTDMESRHSFGKLLLIP